MVWKKKYTRWIVTLSSFFAVLLLMDSCLQFRMSKKEVNKFFADKPQKGILESYIIHQQKINYLTVGHDSLPLVIFVHGSAKFMTAAAFEARLCPTWQNEIKKTKLYTNTSPAAGINFLLAVVRPFSALHSKPFLLSPVN